MALPIGASFSLRSDTFFFLQGLDFREALAGFPTEAHLWARAALRKQVTGKMVTNAIRGALTLYLFRVDFNDCNFKGKYFQDKGKEVCGHAFHTQQPLLPGSSSLPSAEMLLPSGLLPMSASQ